MNTTGSQPEHYSLTPITTINNNTNNNPLKQSSSNNPIIIRKVKKVVSVIHNSSLPHHHHHHHHVNDLSSSATLSSSSSTTRLSASFPSNLPSYLNIENSNNSTSTSGDDDDDDNNDEGFGEKLHRKTLVKKRSNAILKVIEPVSSSHQSTEKNENGNSVESNIDNIDDNKKKTNQLVEEFKINENAIQSHDLKGILFKKRKNGLGYQKTKVKIKRSKLYYRNDNQTKYSNIDICTISSIKRLNSESNAKFRFEIKTTNGQVSEWSCSTEDELNLWMHTLVNIYSTTMVDLNNNLSELFDNLYHSLHGNEHAFMKNIVNHLVEFKTKHHVMNNTNNGNNNSTSSGQSSNLSQPHGNNTSPHHQYNNVKDELKYQLNTILNEMILPNNFNMSMSGYESGDDSDDQINER